MTCAFIYPLTSGEHHLEFAPDKDDVVPVPELPIVESIEQDFGAKRVEASLGGLAAFEINDEQLEEFSPFLRDMCRVVPVNPEVRSDFLSDQTDFHYLSPFKTS